MIVPRTFEFKTSVALALLGFSATPKQLQDLVGKQKPPGQHHMRYTAEDLRTARYRRSGIDPKTVKQSGRKSNEIPPLIVTRMTKGGVGKTSVSVNVATALAMMGYRVLFIDADTQGSGSSTFGIDVATLPVQHVGNFLVRSNDKPDADLQEALFRVYENGPLDVLAADITLAESDSALVASMGAYQRAELFLKRNAKFLNQTYDVIVVDTAPGTTPIGVAFTFAAKANGRVLTVIEAEGSCIRALDSIQSNLEEISRVAGAHVDMEIVINKYHPSFKHVRESMGELYSRFSNKLNDVVIPQFVGFSQQVNPVSRLAMPLVESNPVSVGADAIIQLAKSLVTSFGIHHPGLPVIMEGDND